MNLGDFFGLVAASISAGGLAGGAVLWLGKTWLSERLKQSIQHEYAINFERFKADLERYRAGHAAATASMAAGQVAAREKTLAAIERLWSTMLQINANAPTIVGYVDILTREEQTRLLERPQGEQFTSMAEEQIREQMERIKGIEAIRPFVGEELWLLFFTYRAFIFRVAIHHSMGARKGHTTPWQEDSGVQQILGYVLDKTERDDVLSKQAGGIATIRGMIEHKVLVRSHAIISGEAMADATLKKLPDVFRKLEEIAEADARRARSTA